MIKEFYLVLLVVILFFLSCEYKSPFNEIKGRDLISGLDLSTDWERDYGLSLDVTSDSPPNGESPVYYLNFLNIIAKYSSFEESDLSDLTNYWHPSLDNSPLSRPPEIFEVVKQPGVMKGDGYLHIKLQKNPEPQYVAYRFNALKDKNYLFKFDFKIFSGDMYQLSFGDYNNTEDELKVEEQFTEGVVMFDITSFRDSLSEVRFGYKNIYSEAKVLDFFVDNIALFVVGNVNIRKIISIVGSVEATDDNTGEKFYEGVYRLTLFAKKGTSSKLTLRLGTRYKEFDLTSHWSEIKLEAQILKEQNFLHISIMPTVTDEIRRFPGGIYITKPKLFFLPDKSSPD